LPFQAQWCESRASINRSRSLAAIRVAMLAFGQTPFDYRGKRGGVGHRQGFWPPRLPAQRPKRPRQFFEKGDRVVVCIEHEQLGPDAALQFGQLRDDLRAIAGHCVSLEHGIGK